MSKYKHYFLLILILAVNTVFAEGDNKKSQPSALEQFRKPKICLTMIVKNESKIIERCLNSTKDIIDCLSICDTGSTDNTVELIENFMKKNGIRGKVHHHTWKNFGHNRTLSVEAAVETLKELKIPQTHTFLLLLDADMILIKEPNFRKEDLIADSYMVEQQSDTMAYYNTRLVRASLPWECVGVTHEYWSCAQTNRGMRLEALKIDDREDGGSKADKFERDVRLLTQGLKDEPDNDRYLFYLAQSYMCLDQLDEAIKWYKKRVEKGGWFEEVWYAKMMIGECYERKNEWDTALHWYLEAFQGNPERAEPLKRIATHYRKGSQHNLAHLFAKQGLSIPYPKDQVLFISYPVYEYELDEESSIASYYTPHKEDGFAAADRLILKKSVPENIKEQSYRNIIFYADAFLKNNHFKPVKITLGLPINFYPLAITKVKDGYCVLSQSESEKTKLISYLDKDFKVISQNEISENEFKKLLNPYVVEKEKLIQHKPEKDISHFQIAATPIEFEEGYLMVVYENVADNNRFHRFVFLDNDFVIKNISGPFFYRHKGQETCSGITLDHSGANCLMMVDSELLSIDTQTINALLNH